MFWYVVTNILNRIIKELVKFCRNVKLRAHFGSTENDANEAYNSC